MATLYKSLSEEQRKGVTFPFHHPLRSKVDNNWAITPHKINQFYTADQQAMIKEIFQGVHNPDYVDKVMDHMNEDGGSLGNYSIAIFGRPATGKFEFVLTDGTAPCAVMEIRWKEPLSADRSSMAMRPGTLMRPRTIRQCLLVPGQVGKPGFPGPGRQTTPTGAAHRAPPGTADTNRETR